MKRNLLVLAAVAGLTGPAWSMQEVIVGRAEAEGQAQACANATAEGAARASVGGQGRAIDIGACECSLDYNRSSDPVLRPRQWTCTANIRFEPVGRNSERAVARSEIPVDSPVRSTPQLIVGRAEAAGQGEACGNAKAEGAARASVGGQGRVIDVGACECSLDYNRARDPALRYRQWTCTANVRFESRAAAAQAQATPEPDPFAGLPTRAGSSATSILSQMNDAGARAAYERRAERDAEAFVNSRGAFEQRSGALVDAIGRVAGS